MEDELFNEEVTTESGNDIESVFEVDFDVPTSKYEDTDLYNSEEVTRDILSALEENGYITRSGSNEIRSMESGDSYTTPSGEYYDLLIQMNSHLEYISEHLYETPSGHDVNTPIADYSLTEILLLGTLLLVACIGTVKYIKENVLHLR